MPAPIDLARSHKPKAASLKRITERLVAFGLRPTIILSLISALAAPVCSAQDEDATEDPCGKPTDKKITAVLEKAAKAKDPVERHQMLKSTLEIDADCAECLFQLGISAFKRASEGGASFDPAIGYLTRLKDKCPEYHSDVYYTLGTMYYAQEKFAESAQAFKKFLDFPRDDAGKLAKDIDKKTADVEEVLPDLKFYMDFYKEATNVEPALVRNVSTAAEEYLPMLSPDNELLFFTRVSKYQARGDLVAKDIEDLTEAQRKNTQEDFDKGIALPAPFNTGDNYGGVTISVNNKEMFVTVCAPPDAKGYRDCNLFRTHYDNHVDFGTGQQKWEWTGLDDLGPNINTPGWESQPSLTADGKTLYFASSRPGSRGIDIYTSTRDKNGEWSAARAVPGPINTEGDDKAPFVHSDSHTLYFASKGHKGIGGYDIFFSRMNDDGTWGAPKNIGNALNTPQDEHGLIVSADGRTAYFASSRAKGAGGLDIYSFAVPTDARPDDIIVVKGQVRDEKGVIVRDAKVEIKYMDTRQSEVLSVDSVDGQYATIVRLKAGTDVIMTVKKEGHVFDSRAFTMEDTARGGVAEVDMKLEKIELGKSYTIDDIHYETGSADITTSSQHILDEFIDFLKENPTVRVEIQGHTDNVGGLDDNMALSNDRSFMVREYIERHGISGARMTSKGYGPTMPVASNDTAKGRAQNRRTEFVITGR